MPGRWRFRGRLRLLRTMFGAGLYFRSVEVLLLLERRHRRRDLLHRRLLVERLPVHAMHDRPDRGLPLRRRRRRDQYLRLRDLGLMPGLRILGDVRSRQHGALYLLERQRRVAGLRRRGHVGDLLLLVHPGLQRRRDARLLLRLRPVGNPGLRAGHLRLGIVPVQRVGMRDRWND